MTLADLLTFAIALAISAAAPGPGITALVARALGVGFWATVPMMFGLILGDLTFLAAAVFGLAAVAKTWAAVFGVIKYAGAAYLAVLAVKLWRTNPAGMDVAAAPQALPRRWWLRSFLGGLTLTLGNPKVILFYLALLPTLIDLARLTVAGFAELAVALVLVLLLVCGSYIAAAARARAVFRSARARRSLDRAAGTVMAGAALAVALR